MLLSMIQNLSSIRYRELMGTCVDRLFHHFIQFLINILTQPKLNPKGLLYVYGIGEHSKHSITKFLNLY